MATRIIKPAEADWPIIRAFLEACGGAAIIIPPDFDRKLKEQGIEIGDGARIEYSFDSAPNHSIDVAEEMGGAAVLAIKEHLGVEE